MITKISNTGTNDFQQTVAFKGRPISELNGRILKLTKEAKDSFSKLTGKTELPFTKKSLIAADYNHGHPVIDVNGDAINDPKMPGTVIHELAKGDQGYVEQAPDFIDSVMDVGKSILKAIFDID